MGSECVDRSPCRNDGNKRMFLSARQEALPLDPLATTTYMREDDKK
jgi:hypothetical protein